MNEEEGAPVKKILKMKVKAAEEPAATEEAQTKKRSKVAEEPAATEEAQTKKRSKVAEEPAATDEPQTKKRSKAAEEPVAPDEPQTKKRSKETAADEGTHSKDADSEAQPKKRKSADAWETTVVKFVGKCSDREDLASTLLTHADSDLVVCAVLEKLAETASDATPETEPKVFDALTRTLASPPSSMGAVELAMAAVVRTPFGSAADSIAAELILTAMRFPELAQRCIEAVNAVRGAEGMKVTW